jgi:hypothetical protein
MVDDGMSRRRETGCGIWKSCRGLRVALRGIFDSKLSLMNLLALTAVKSKPFVIILRYHEVNRLKCRRDSLVWWLPVDQISKCLYLLAAQALGNN